MYVRVSACLSACRLTTHRRSSRTVRAMKKASAARAAGRAALHMVGEAGGAQRSGSQATHEQARQKRSCTTYELSGDVHWSHCIMHACSDLRRRQARPVEQPPVDLSRRQSFPQLVLLVHVALCTVGTIEGLAKATLRPQTSRLLSPAWQALPIVKRLWEVPKKHVA